MAHVPRLKVLADETLNRIQDASIQLSEKTGVVFECEEAVCVFKKNAVKVDGRKVFVSGKLAETAVENAPATFTWRKPVPSWMKRSGPKCISSARK